MLAQKNTEVTVTLPSDRAIRFTRSFARPPELLFEAWTRPEHLRAWWGCSGSKVTECAVDLRVGGEWRLVLLMPDGSVQPFRGAYREIVPPNRLVYTECYVMPALGSPEWLTTVTFEQSPGCLTLLTHTILHQSREARDGHLKAGMESGEIDTLEKLDTCCAALEAK